MTNDTKSPTGMKTATRGSRQSYFYRCPKYGRLVDKRELRDVMLSFGSAMFCCSICAGQTPFWFFVFFQFGSERVKFGLNFSSVLS